MKKAEGVFMYIRGRLKNDFVSALEIPEDLAYQEMIVTMTGTNHVMVENYRSIQKLTPEEIVILGSHGKVQIIGKRMEISHYTPQEMLVTGYITEIRRKR